MKIQVQIVQGPAADCAFVIEKNSSCLVGRGEEADFQIENDELISREHFVVGFDGKAVTLTDLGSTNGTFVDGHALVKDRPVCLTNGQSFIAGRVSKFVVSFVGQPQHPTPPAPAPAGGLPQESSPPGPVNPQTNFGSSVFMEGDGPPQVAPASPDSAGGNFSQSIVKGMGGGPGLGDDSDFGGASDQSDLLFANPSPGQGINLGDTGGVPVPSRPTEPSSFPPSAENQPYEPLPLENHDQNLGYEGSIAAPGDVDGIAYNFPPLAGDEPVHEQPSPEALQPTPPPDGPPARPPAPTKVIESVEQQSPNSPFASVQQTPAPPVADQPTQPENPTREIPPQPSTSAVYHGSIYAPGQANQAQTDSFSLEESSADDGSILLPNQMPIDRPKQSVSPEEKTEIPPGKTGFIFRELPNGLFFHSGTDESDVPLVLAALQKGFESIYCAHLSRTGIEIPAAATELAKKPKPEPEKTEVGSNFESLDSELEASSVHLPFDSLDVEENTPRAPAPPKSSALQFGVPLFFWLPEEAQSDFPILLSEEEFTFEIEDFWNADALVCLFGSSAEQLADHCLELIRTDLRTGKKAEGVFGFCWPTVLHSTLESQGEKAVNRIFQGGVAAFLVEDPQQEFAWNIISKTDMTEYLSDFGFVRQASE